MEQLQKMGIQLGFLISGLFGAILMATKNEKTDVKSVVLSLVGGMSAANFLTPVLVDALNIANVKHQNGVAFIAGFLGLKLVELISEKFLEKINGSSKGKIKKRKPRKS
jgi:hypothetical protein